MPNTKNDLIKAGLELITTLDERAEIHTHEALYSHLQTHESYINATEFVDLEEVIMIIEEKWIQFDSQLNELYGLATDQDSGLTLSATESERYMELVECLQTNNISIPFAIEY